jgi:transposase-like protein
MSTSGVSSKKSRKKKVNVKGLQGRRFTPEQKAHALELVATGRTREAAGTTEESVRRWVREAEATGTMPPAPMTASATKRAKASEKESAESTTEKSTSTVELSTPASKEPSRSIYAPKDPGQGLSSAEQAAILELKKRHPSYGPAQIRTQLKRFKG